MMAGTIGARSVVGEGSTFWFEVPLRAAEHRAAARAGRDVVDAGKRDPSGALSEAMPVVLVAEDNPINQQLAVRMLDRCGYRAEIASDGREALAAIEMRRYAAVLMDCQMPDMDGYEATAEIRRREQGGPSLTSSR